MSQEVKSMIGIVITTLLVVIATITIHHKHYVTVPETQQGNSIPADLTFRALHAAFTYGWDLGNNGLSIEEAEVEYGKLLKEVGLLDPVPRIDPSHPKISDFDDHWSGLRGWLGWRWDYEGYGYPMGSTDHLDMDEKEVSPDDVTILY